MVRLVTNTSSIDYKENITTPLAVTSSVDASYSDPDLLIREYFLSNPNQRALSRKTIVKHVSSVRSILEILSRGASGKAHESYDGAVNLLAEISDYKLLEEVCQAVEKPYLQLARNPSTKLFAESFLEILTKAIACAYKISASQRLRLLTRVLPQTNQRILKAALIDALTILSDEADRDVIRTRIEDFTADSDQYIRDYATEALDDII